MAMLAGDESCTTGMSLLLYNNILTELGGSFPSGFDATSTKKFIYAICNTIVTYLKSNMDITGVTSTVATAIPCAVDPGTHIGATTSTGSSTQNNTVHPN